MKPPEVYVHHQVVLWAPSDLPEASRVAGRAVERASRGLARDGLAYDFRPLQDLPPGLDTGGVQDRYRQHFDEAAVVVLALSARFDESTQSLADYAVAYWEENQRPRVMVYVSETAPVDRDNEEALEEMIALAQFKKRFSGIVATFSDLTDFERKLADHLEQLGPELSHRETTKRLPLRPYLDWLIRQHATLTVPGISGTNLKKLPLNQIFIKLRMQALGRLDLGLPDVLPRTAPLAIVGDPGSGKTTLLRYVALNLARSKVKEAAHELGYEDDPPTPILVNIREAVDKLGTDFPAAPSLSQWGLILESTVSASGLRATTEDAQSLLLQGSLLLMFDGLDEVAGRATRAQVARALTALADIQPKNRVVVTCRTRAWDEDPAFGRFEEAEIQPLDEGGIRLFARRWTEAAGESAEGLENAILENRMVRKIATNPQMLTMLAALYSAQRQLPSQRAALYKECVEWLLRSKEKELKRYGGAPAALRAHTYLARKLQEAKDEAGRPRQALERFEAESHLRDHLGTGTLDDAREYLRNLELYVGLIVASGSKVQFHHRTFQEYLVARDLADATDPALKLGERVDDPQWLEVIALLGGLLADQGETRLKKYLEDLVPQRGSIEEKAPRVGIIAQCLEDLSAWSLPPSVLEQAQDPLQEVLPIFQDPEQKTPEKVRIAVAEGLGRTKDPRLQKELRWVHVPAGRFWRGAAPDDPEAHENEVPAGWVEISEFYIHRWPVTVGEYTTFVELGGYEQRSWWSDEGWAWRTEEEVSWPQSWDTQEEYGSHPVTGVSWWEAQAFARWMRSETHLWSNHCTEVRLPTEAEWEKAARGGEVLADRSENPDPKRRYAWLGAFGSKRCNDGPRTCPVGCYPGGINALGLWDITGNVWEWCIDGWRGGQYPSVFERDPVGTGSERVVRGGAWYDGPLNLRVSFRLKSDPRDRNDLLGFRLVKLCRGCW